MLSESVSKVENAITLLKEKFLQTPFSFYSETDMHCFLHNVLYQDNYFNESLDARLDDKQLIQTIRLHREYPTLGKFYKRGKLLIPVKNNYINVDGKRMQPSRGAYDLAVIEPSIEADFKHQKNNCSNRASFKRA